MSTPLPLPAWNAWTGGIANLRDNEITLNSVNGSAKQHIDNLVPGHTITVTYTLTAHGTNPIASIDDVLIPLTSSRKATVTATVTAADTITFELSGITSATIHTRTITDTATLPQFPIPAHVLSVQAQYPDATTDAFRFDSSRWNRARFNEQTHAERNLIWNTGAWNQRRWWTDAGVEHWQDITQKINSIATIKGVNASGPIMAAAVGTLTLDAVDALDPRATGMQYGTPIKVIHWPTRQVIFTGTLAHIQMEYAPPGSTWNYRTTLTATDHVATLANITRYGAKADANNGNETWNERIRRLMKSAPTVTYATPSQSHTLMCATVWETNLAAHIDAAAASVNGCWNVDRNNIAQIRAGRPPLTPELIFTDAQPTNPAQKIWSFNAVNVTWKTTETAAAVYLTNHAAIKDENAQWVANDTNAKAEAPTFSSTWSGQTVQVDTTLVSGLTDAARALIRQSTSTPAPSKIELTPCHAHGPANRNERMAASAIFDPLTPVEIHLTGDSHKALITKVEHTITAKTWHTQIELTPNR